MSAIEPGALADVTIKGVRYTGENEDGLPVVADENGDMYPLPAHAEMERADPAEWPPQQGDLWRDSLGSLWFALGRHVLMVPGDPVGDLGGYEPDKVLAKVGPLALVYREESTS